MEQRKWQVVDIYYKAGERKQALKRAKYYERQGYDPAQEDEGFGEWDGSFQLIRISSIKQIVN